ncbi:MAG TPA: low affinity iron permease family protein [Xanthobacteraceae bacterium]|jgi:low affinity Fe/Cu permease
MTEFQIGGEMSRNGNKNGTPCNPAALETKAAVKRPINKLFGEIARVISREVGRAWVFVVAVISIVIWGLSGPLFGFSDTWQLVINTGTTIVTFLMVFLIQNAQNRDAAAIQVKLDELIRASRARNSFVGLENLTDEELEMIRERCALRAKEEGADQGRPGARRKIRLQSLEVNSNK